MPAEGQQKIHGCASSLRDLQHLVATSMGPMGADKVVQTDAKALLVTNGGADLLGVLSPGSPLLSLVVQSVKGFAHTHGDGSKRLLVLVSEGLHEVLRQVQHAPSSTSLIAMVRGLSALQSGYLDLVFEEVAAAMQLQIDLPAQRACSPAATPDVSGACQEVVSALLSTHMANKVGSRAVRHLAQLTTELACGRLQRTDVDGSSSSEGNSSAWSTLRDLHAQPPLCLLPGGMVTSSRLVPGIVLCAALASPHMYPVLERRTDLGFVVLDCALDAADGQSTGSAASAAGLSVTLGSAQQLQAAARLHQRSVRGRLELLASRGVGLLLSTQPATPLLTFLCLEAGVALAAGLDADDARGVCAAARIRMTDSCRQAALQDASIAGALGCYRLSLGRESGLVLKLPGQGISTLLLAAPSDGLCRQYAKLVRSGLAVLAASVAASGGGMGLLGEGPQQGATRLSLDQEEASSSSPAQRAGAAGRGSDDSAPGPSHATGAGDSPQPERLILLPGGGAFDAALAVRLEQAMQAVRGGCNGSGSTQAHVFDPGSSEGLLAALLLQQPPPALLPALRVLRAMAVAVPTTLCGTAAKGASASDGQGAPSFWNGAIHAQRRHTTLQLHSLLACHRGVPARTRSSGVGLLHVDSAPGLTTGALRALGVGEPPVPNQQQQHGGDDAAHASTASSLTLSPTACHGVLEAKDVVVSLWSHAVSLLIQVLRIDAVVAAASCGAPAAAVQLPRANPTVKKGFDLQDDFSADEEMDAASDSSIYS